MLKDIFFQIPPKKPQKNSKLFPNTSILTELCGADNKYHLKVQTDTKKILFVEEYFSQSKVQLGNTSST